MKQQPTVETVEVRYYGCGDPLHRHRKIEVAKACIQLREDRQRRAEQRPRIDPQIRDEEIVTRRKDGWTLKRIGDSVGLSANRVRMIIRFHSTRMAERARREKDSLYPLRVQVIHALHHHGIKTIEDLLNATSQGSDLEPLAEIYGIGHRSIEDIDSFLKGKRATTIE